MNIPVIGIIVVVVAYRLYQTMLLLQSVCVCVCVCVFVVNALYAVDFVLVNVLVRVIH